MVRDRIRSGSQSPALQAATRPEDGLLRTVQIRAGAFGAAALSPCPLPAGEGVKPDSRPEVCLYPLFNPLSLRERARVRASPNPTLTPSSNPSWLALKFLTETD